MSEKIEIFISYARKDGEVFSDWLIKELKRELSKVTVYKDHLFMEGGKHYWEQIVNKIDSSQFLILIMTPALIQSENVRDEWYYARRHGKCVYPVMNKEYKKDKLNFKHLPRCLQKAHFYDLDKEWTGFITDLKSACREVKVLYPFPPEDEVEPMKKMVFRTKMIKRLYDLLLDGKMIDPRCTTAALIGPGGYGKTSLAQIFCQNNAVREAYCDGIHWVTLGEQVGDGKFKEEFTRLYNELTEENQTFGNFMFAKKALEERIEGLKKTFLIILDNVWELSHIEPFLSITPTCSHLITTRKEDVLEKVYDESIIEVEKMENDESVELLTKRLNPKSVKLNRRAFDPLVKRLGQMPLLLELAGASLKIQVRKKRSLKKAVSSLTSKFERKGITALDKRDRAIKDTIEISMDYLITGRKGKKNYKKRERFIQLAVFPKGEEIPMPLVSALWELESSETEDRCLELDNFSLIKCSLGDEEGSGFISIHDVIHEYIYQKLDKPQEVVKMHSRIVDALQQTSEKDKYKMNNLLIHLIKSHRWGDLENVLTDIKFLKKKREPELQWRFEQAFKTLIRYDDIPDDILPSILKEVFDTIAQKLKKNEDKTDWLDTFAYWIINFSSEGDAQKRPWLKEMATQFDKECGIISTNLSKEKKKGKDYGWAMRYAELATWVYQRSDVYSDCIKACKYAEDLCNLAAKEKKYRHLLRAEYIRMRARAFNRRAMKNKDELIVSSELEQETKEAYKDLITEFALGGENIWKLSIKDWKLLEEYTSKNLLEPPSPKGGAKKTKFRAQVVSNTHDAISAMFVIQYLVSKGGKVQWLHTDNYEIGDFAQKGTKIAVLIGGPKSPGIELVANRFYEADKDKFLEAYSAKQYAPIILETREGDAGEIYCFMAGGPSKANTIKAAHDLISKLKEPIREV